MKNKLGKMWRFFYGVVFLLAFFSCLRIIVLYYYHLQQAKGNYTLGMALMDKASVFNLTSYVSGILHGWVAGIMVLIVINK